MLHMFLVSLIQDILSCHHLHLSKYQSFTSREKFCSLLCETRVELSYVSDIKPADLLLHDAAEKQDADTFDLPSCCQGPQGHLKVSRDHCSNPHEAVVDCQSVQREVLKH